MMVAVLLRVKELALGRYWSGVVQDQGRRLASVRIQLTRGRMMQEPSEFAPNEEVSRE